MSMEPDWDAYSEGYDARYAGKTLHDNPYYGVDAHKFQSWRAGWALADESNPRERAQ
ncbi:MAG: hypothetical protein ABSA66_15900 [Roseiarcus sp.]|jgi:ribosome modulation factor